MKHILNKVKWTGILLFIFLSILATNLLDRNHVRDVKKSVSTIYKDRLIVKNIIYNIASLREEKKIAFLQSDSTFYEKRNQSINDSIFSLIDRFSATVLTQKEVEYLERLYDNFKTIEVMDNKIISQTSKLNDKEWRKVVELEFSRTKDNLTSLSEIQVKEGKRELARVSRTFNKVDLFTTIEIIFLIAISVIILIIILYPTKNKK